MEFTDILYEKKDGVAKITINRPEKMNALRFKTWSELYTAITDASSDNTVGVIVITGAGDKAFCAGGDQNEQETLEYCENATKVAESIIYAPKPVIAAVNGYSLGGGHWLHVLCDLTIASENAVFGQTGPRVGSAAFGIMVAYLARVVGEKKAREIWMLCRRYSAKEALEMGLVNKVVPQDKLEEEVDKWCREILSLSPTCLKTVKASFAYALHMDVVGTFRARELIAPNFYLTEESQEGVKAFLEKREPDYSKFRK
ncbi:MAG: enoyl-CoA hydratase-related protein [Candidatus Syntropharchaeia archaeon]